MRFLGVNVSKIWSEYPFPPHLFLLTQVDQLHSHNPPTQPLFMLSLHSVPLLKNWILPAPLAAKMERKQTLVISYFTLGPPCRWPSSLAVLCHGAWACVMYRPMWAAAPHQYKLHRHMPYTVRTAGLQTEFMCRKATVWAKWKDPGCGPDWQHLSCGGIAVDRNTLVQVHAPARSSRYLRCFRTPLTIICRLYGAVVCVIHRCSWRRCFSLTACRALMFHGPYHWRSAW